MKRKFSPMFLIVLITFGFLSTEVMAGFTISKSLSSTPKTAYTKAVPGIAFPRGTDKIKPLPPAGTYCDENDSYIELIDISGTDAEVYHQKNVHYYMPTSDLLTEVDIPECAKIDQVKINGVIIGNEPTFSGEPGDYSPNGPYYSFTKTILADSRAYLSLHLYGLPTSGNGVTQILSVKFVGISSPLPNDLVLNTSLVPVLSIRQKGFDLEKGFVITEEDWVNRIVPGIHDLFGPYNSQNTSFEGGSVLIKEFDYDNMKIENTTNGVELDWNFKVHAPYCTASVNIAGTFKITRDVGQIVVDWPVPMVADIDLPFSLGICQGFAAIFEDLEEMEQKIEELITRSLTTQIEASFPDTFGGFVSEIVHETGKTQLHLLDWNAVTINVPYRTTGLVWSNGTELPVGDPVLITVDDTADVCDFDGTIVSPACNSTIASASGLPNFSQNQSDPIIPYPWEAIGGVMYFKDGSYDARNRMYSTIRVLDLPAPTVNVGALMVKQLSLFQRGTPPLQNASSICRVNATSMKRRIVLSVNDYISQDSINNHSVFGFPYGGNRKVSLIFPDNSGNFFPECGEIEGTSETLPEIKLKK